MPHTSEQPSGRYLGYFDAARGLAALMVMGYHFINGKYDGEPFAPYAYMLFNGSDAVSFFFVLSGFVLSYKYIVYSEPLDIGKFYITRFLRLWPAFFITIVLNTLNGHRNSLDLETVKDLFVGNITHFWQEAPLIRNIPFSYMPGWTLTIELALSLMIPFWIVIAQRDKRLICWLLLAYLLIGNTMKDMFMFHFHFGLGVLASCLFTFISSNSLKTTKWYRYRHVILLAGVLLFSSRQLARIWPPGPSYTYVAKYLGIDFFHYTAIGAFIIIAAIIASRNTQRILSHGILRFFGKISYGIYLMHWALVSDTFDYWYKVEALTSNPTYRFLIAFSLYSAATILLATIVHYAIELPFIQLGKRLVKRMKPTLVVGV